MFDQDLEKRLSCWAQFRQSLETASNPLEMVAHFWSQAPLSGYVTHVNIADGVWPTPWQLIEVNRYDDQALAIMIGYTIKLTERYKSSLVELKTMVDHKQTKLYNLIFIDNTYILNYLRDQVVTVNDIDLTTCSSNIISISSYQ